MSPSSPKDVDPRIRHLEYKCSACGQPTPRSDLTAKEVAFVAMGPPRKNLRQRTVAWLCPPCRDADEIWNLPARSTAPGMSDTKLTR